MTQHHAFGISRATATENNGGVRRDCAGDQGAVADRDGLDHPVLDDLDAGVVRAGLRRDRRRHCAAAGSVGEMGGDCRPVRADGASEHHLGAPMRAGVGGRADGFRPVADHRRGRDGSL